MTSVEPHRQRFQAFLEGAELPGPVVMINLLRFHEQAQYPDDFEAEPCSGREAYKRYSKGVLQRIEAAQGRVIYRGKVQDAVIAPDGEEWDKAFLVEYPNRKAFVDMVAHPDYRVIAPHRTAALLDSRLIATQPESSGQQESSHVQRDATPFSRSFRYTLRTWSAGMA